MKYSLSRLLAFSVLLLSSSLHAQLAIDRIIVDFLPDSNITEDVLLINESDSETLFIDVDILQVSEPGTEKEQRLVVDDPSKIGLIATPAKVILPPGSRRNVRLVNMLDERDSESIFRVNFSPVAAETDRNENEIRLMLGYQALVIVRPDNPVIDLDSQRKDGEITLANNGNTNVFLERVRQCTDSELTECVPLGDRRLYPGNNASIELNGEGTVVFDVYDGKSRVTRKI